MNKPCLLAGLILFWMSKDLRPFTYHIPPSSSEPPHYFVNLHKKSSSPTWGIYVLIQGTVPPGCGFRALNAGDGFYRVWFSSSGRGDGFYRAWFPSPEREGGFPRVWFSSSERGHVFPTPGSATFSVLHFFTSDIYVFRFSKYPIR